MAKYTFYTQSKSSFWYSYSLMNWVIFGYFLFASIQVFAFGKSTFVFLPFFLLVLYNIFLYKPTVKYWDMGGFKKMVIDTDARAIIFDDKTKLKFDRIERVRIQMDERPTMFWFLAFGRQYLELVNGEVFFRLDTKMNTVVNMQYRKDIKKLISVMKDIHKPCRVQNMEYLDEGVPVYIWYLLFLIFGVGGFAFMVVMFFKTAFTMV